MNNKIIFLILVFFLFQNNSFSQEFQDKMIITRIEKLLSDDRSEWEINYLKDNVIIAKQFYFSDGHESMIGTIPNGRIMVYYDEGQIKKEFTLLNGKRNGVCKYYYQNGHVLREMTYFDGKLEGFAKEFYSNGNLKFFELWENNYLDGIRVSYSRDGQLLSKQQYKRSLLNGVCFTKNGDNEKATFYKNGVEINDIFN